MRPEDIPFPTGALLPTAGREPVRVRWLGTAGFDISFEGHHLLIDPYVTRASLGACVFSPLRSDAAAVARYAPQADAIVCGHTHFDHALDVPAIALATGATVFGSHSAAALCRAFGVPASQVRDVEATSALEPLTAEVGPFTLRFHPGVHSRFLLGRVPFPGDISDCEQVPLRTEHYKCGAVFGVEVRVADRVLFHLGSADLVDAVKPGRIDLLLMCVAGWTTTRDFPSRVMRTFSPGAVLLSHWDNFFLPMASGARMFPAMKLPRLVEALSAQSRGLTLGTVPLLGEVSL